jgi:alpha-1,3-mannosyltransferase
MLGCNFVGIVFSRTLHYQFYAWYFHSLPLLLWLAPIPTAARLCLFAAIEAAWSTFPPTANNSYGLLLAHAILLGGLFFVATGEAGAERERRVAKPQRPWA